MKKTSIYLNAKQLLFLRSRHKRKTFMGGRGCGKSTVLGFYLYLCMRYLPGAKWVLLGITYKQLNTKTVKALKEAWSLLGCMPYNPRTGRGHYVVGKRPPAHFKQAVSAPEDFDHVIYFRNGFHIEMISQEVAQENRGGSYDGGAADEEALLDQEFVTQIGEASIRGNRYRFKHWLHGSFCSFTSIPRTTKGLWVFKVEEEMIREQQLVKAGKLKKSECRYLFVEARSDENLLVLGEDYIERQRAAMQPWDFEAEIMNQRPRKLPNGFYPSLERKHHAVSDVHKYVKNSAGEIVAKLDKFLNLEQKLELSFDFNAGFTSMIVCQEIITGEGIEFRVGDSLWVKPMETDNNLIDALVDKFCEAYKYHYLKVVDVYGDRNGNSKSAGSTLTFYEQIIIRLEKHGWSVFKRPERDLDMAHDLRHFLVNALLKEESPTWPKVRFHFQKADGLLTSMERAPILEGFKKDKADEKRPVPQELATHLSDCFDNIVCRKYDWILTGDTGHQIWLS